jgi:hypothetical protein
MNYEFEERCGILEFDGGVPRLEAEQLARERPWDTDPTWGMPRPVQAEMDLGLQDFRAKMKKIWTDY